MKRFYYFALIYIFWNPISAQDRKQPNLSFETDYFQALDHWVVLPELDRLLLGYIYADPKLGFTFALQSPIKINGGVWLLSAEVKPIIKKTLDSKTPKVMLVPQSKVTLLRLPPKPPWLKIYDANAYENLFAKGVHYNTIGQHQLAIPILEKAFKISPKAAFELGYAYNKNQQFGEAIIILNEALQLDAKNYMLYRELGFALVQCKQIEEAEKVYEIGFSMCTDDQKLEMAIDMASLFYDLKRQEQFVKWHRLIKKYTPAKQQNALNRDPAEWENED